MNYGVENFGVMADMLVRLVKKLMRTSLEITLKNKVEKENSLSCSNSSKDATRSCLVELHLFRFESSLFKNERISNYFCTVPSALLTTTRPTSSEPRGSPMWPAPRSP